MSKTSFKPNKELSAVCEQMWKADTNRLTPEVDYSIDPQGRTRYNTTNDSASDPFFSYLKPDVLKKGTYAAFVKLLDNYTSDTGKREVVTQEEINENRIFIDLIYETGPIQIAHKYLASKGLVPADRPSFKKKLYSLWFDLYSRTRGCRGDSSGFEHVFVGETRNKEEVIGFHNWIQFYLQEKAGLVDYKGFFPNRNKRRASSEEMKECQLMTIKFSWKNGMKPLGSSFIGTSPEFEVAMYTVCFLAGGGKDVHLDMEEYDVIIKIHEYSGGKYIGSCYPQAA
ncbi:poly(U)-specific endoribonuclease-B-like [Actinia tenebrosa]|uniref:Uridylate-specific endoribonuclease n=1 Tax=Actinia tenebrosa TaxID=6105 RepID=A0A6P8HW80_ACTTE|nr:poly(U)-specific endoribonuclease-B-like [Actinia tenebrosa]